MFLHVSVILFAGEGLVSQHALQQVSGGGGIPACLSRGVSQHALQVSRPTPRREVEGSGLGGGVSRPTPGGISRPTPRGVYPSMH